MRTGMREFRYPPGVDPWFKIGVIQPVTISLGIPDHRTHQPHTLSGMTTILMSTRIKGNKPLISHNAILRGLKDWLEVNEASGSVYLPIISLGELFVRLN